MKKKIEDQLPKVFNTKAYRRLEEAWSKPPTVSITPRNVNDKEDRKKAKLMEKIMNHAFKTNANGITLKYMQAIRLAERKFLYEEMTGIQVSLDVVEKLIKDIAKQPKKYADLLNLKEHEIEK